MGTHGSGRRAEKGDLTIHSPQLFYGRRKARPLRASRTAALETVLPKIKIDRPENAALFSFTPREIQLEIGFGNGDALARWHRENPEIGFIGCEPFINGVSNLCKLVQDDDLGNLRIWPDIAQPLLDGLPAQSVDRVYVLNPDPWPKKRHHRRRFINPENLKRLSRILKPGGTLVMTTDVADLAAWMLEQALACPDFAWTAQSKADWETPPPDWLATRYETKGAAQGRRQTYLVFKKVLQNGVSGAK